jgi:hypothetical protein
MDGVEGISPLVAARFARLVASSRKAAARLRFAWPYGTPSLTARRRARLCSEEGLGGVRGQVAGHAPIHDIGQVALEDAAGLLGDVVVGARRRRDARRAALSAAG